MTAGRTHIDDVSNILSKRARERMADAVMRNVVSITGLRPTLLPASVMQQLHHLGLRGRDLIGQLAGIRSMADWPYVWEAEADVRAARGEWSTAAMLYYLAQRILPRQTLLKQRLYSASVHAYEQAEHVAPIERVSISHAHHNVAGYLQVPEPREAGEQVPLIVMVPGVTATKEEFHPFTDAFLRRGRAVLRIDNPGYGETSGVMDESTAGIAGASADAVALDERIDADNVFLLGTSMGGFWAVHGSIGHNVRGVISVSAPFAPGRWIRSLPTGYQQAMQHMTGDQPIDYLYRLVDELDLAHHADRVTAPVMAFHGARDTVVPPVELARMGRALSSGFAGTMYRNEFHVCLGESDEITAQTLAWMDDTDEVLDLHESAAADLPAHRRMSTSSRLLDTIHVPRTLTQASDRLQPAT